MDMGDLKKLLAKFSHHDNKEVYYYLFSKSGFTKELRDFSLKEQLKLIDLADVILS